MILRCANFKGGKPEFQEVDEKKGAPWKKWCKYANKSGIHDKNGKTINRISIWAVDCCKTPLSHCQTIQKCKWDHIHQPGHWAGPMAVTTIVQGDERIFPQTNLTIPGESWIALNCHVCLPEIWSQTQHRMPKLFHKTLEEEQFGGLDSTKPKCHWWNAKDVKKKEHPNNSKPQSRYQRFPCRMYKRVPFFAP